MRKSRLSQHKQSELLKLFVGESTDRTAAALADVNKKTATYYFQRLRLLIIDNSQNFELLEGEVDERYFGGRRKSELGRSEADKVPVFGFLKHNVKVYAIIIHDTKTDTLMPIFRQKVKLDSIVYTVTFKSYNALDLSECKLYRINHSELFSNKQNHINGIENF